MELCLLRSPPVMQIKETDRLFEILPNWRVPFLIPLQITIMCIRQTMFASHAILSKY